MADAGQGGQPVQGPAEVQRLHVYETVKLAAVRSMKHCVGEETQANVEEAVITAVNNCGTWYVQHEENGVAGAVREITEQRVDVRLAQQLQAAVHNAMQPLIQGFQNVVQGLQNEVQGLRNEVQGLRNEVQGLRNEVGGLKNQVTGLQHSVDRLGHTNEHKETNALVRQANTRVGETEVMRMPLVVRGAAQDGVPVPSPNSQPAIHPDAQNVDIGNFGEAPPIPNGIPLSRLGMENSMSIGQTQVLQVLYGDRMDIQANDIVPVRRKKVIRFFLPQ